MRIKESFTVAALGLALCASSAVANVQVSALGSDLTGRGRPFVHPERPAAKPEEKPALALAPNGAGAPEAITCRSPQLLPGSRLPGPPVCKTNREWADLKAQGLEVSEDGQRVVHFGSNAVCVISPTIGNNGSTGSSSGASYADVCH